MLTDEIHGTGQKQSANDGKPNYAQRFLIPMIYCIGYASGWLGCWIWYFS